MLRLLLRLIGIKDFEVCASCETLKQQLAFERSEKAALTETLLSILKPKEVEAAPVEVNPLRPVAATFSRRRSILEAKDREDAKILQEKKHLGMPDNLRDIKKDVVTGPVSIQQLEEELGVEENQKNG